MGCVPVEIKGKVESKDPKKDDIKKEDGNAAAKEENKKEDPQLPKVEAVPEKKPAEVNNGVIPEKTEPKKPTAEIGKKEESKGVIEKPDEKKKIEKGAINEGPVVLDDEDQDMNTYLDQEMVEPRDFPITGSWKYKSKEEDMKFDSVKVGEKGRMKFIGSDSEGKFEMIGKFKEDAVVYLRKKYENGTFILKGKFEDDTITGEIKGGKGTFKLKFNLPTNFTATANILRLNVGVPMVGIVNSASRKWGFIFADKQICDVKDGVKIYFVGGNEEIIQCELQSEGTVVLMDVGGASETYM